VNAVFPPRKAGQQDDDGPTKQDAR
jgi:hypothetical protein